MRNRIKKIILILTFVFICVTGMKLTIKVNASHLDMGKIVREGFETDSGNAGNRDNNGGSANRDTGSNIEGSNLVDTNLEGKEEVFFTPKIMVESYTSTVLNKVEDSQGVIAGSHIRLDIKLKNTSKDTDIKNMTVVISMPNEYFQLLSISDVVYIDTFKADSQKTITYEIKIADKVPGGQYVFPLAFDYADERGGVMAGNGFARVDVGQLAEIQFSNVNMEDKVIIGDSVKLSFQAINLGTDTVYNVRADLEGEGFKADEIMYMGTIPGESESKGEMLVKISGLKGDNPYGETKGTITYYYEDADGTEYTYIQEIVTFISSPFSENKENEKKDDSQWWIIMLVISVIITGFGVMYLVRTIKTMF